MNATAIRSLLSLRAAQGFRYLKDLGILPAILLILVISAGYAVITQHPSLHQFPEYWCLAQWLVIFGTHFQNPPKLCRKIVRFLI